MEAIDQSLAVMITSRIDVSSLGCWLWRNVLVDGTQPVVTVGGRERSALRVCWTAYRGELPPKHQVQRTCGDRRCVNPEHLALRSLTPPGQCKNGHDTSGHRGPCRECERERQEKRKAELLSRVTDLHGKQVSAYFMKNRAGHLRKYGLTEQDLLTMLVAQSWQCAICSGELSIQSDDQKQWPNIDHCHTTNRVRGVLCMRCNTALGYLRDSPTFCRRAAGYLEGTSMPQQCTVRACVSHPAGGMAAVG